VNGRLGLRDVKFRDTDRDAGRADLFSAMERKGGSGWSGWRLVFSRLLTGLLRMSLRPADGPVTRLRMPDTDPTSEGSDSRKNPFEEPLDHHRRSGDKQSF